MIPLSPFKNEPTIDWKQSEYERVLNDQLTMVRNQFGKSYPLIIGSENIYTEREAKSINPSNHKEVIGYVAQADKKIVDQAITVAKNASLEWKKLNFSERAFYLVKMAQLLRKRKAEFIAWLMYESGKNSHEADGEVNEAIDFLEIYARYAIELDQRKDLVRLPGVHNEIVNLPLGIGVIIPPWNFPLAILLGLTVSAIVTGNTVLIKPSSSTPVTAVKFMELVKEARIPDGVVNLTPGVSSEIGDYLVTHKDINFVSFTGSKSAGLHIDEQAHKQIEGQKWIKRFVAEMGGKGGIVVDETADLEAAAEAIVTSAFGYQGQKCSAGSRAIIHENVYKEMVELILKETEKLQVGSPLDGNTIGPVIDENAFKKIAHYIEKGKEEATLIYGGEADKSKGFFINPTIFKDADPKSTIMQEEIFGPVLAICKVTDYKAGIDVYNNTEYALTGAYFSTDRQRLVYASDHMICGNLFLNGKCTGARVGVEPFGGYYMSGTGSKIGTYEFLLNFIQEKTISEKL